MTFTLNAVEAILIKPAQNLIKPTTAYISLQYYTEVEKKIPGEYLKSARDEKRTDLKSTYVQYASLWILYMTILEVCSHFSY